MSFLFGIVGFILGAGLFYWLQQRQLAKTQQRLKRVQRDLEHTQKTLEQTETLNRQQATQLKTVQEAKAQTKEPELYYQAQLQERELYYQGQFQELEQSYQARLQGLEQSYQARLQELEQSYQARLQELEESLRASQQLKSPENAREKTEANLEETREDTPESDLSNPFFSHEEQQQESEATLPSELDLDQFLEDLFPDQENSSNELEELLKLEEVKDDSTPGTGDK